MGDWLQADRDGSAAADERDDLDDIRLGEAMIGVVALRNEAPVHLDRAGARREPFGLEEFRDGERRGEFARGAVEADAEGPVRGFGGHGAKCTIPSVSAGAARSPFARLAIALLIPLACLVACALGGCSDPDYDTSTPERALDAAEKMVRDGRPDLLPTLIEIEARDLVFDDGVTEASAIGDVKEKLGDMLGRLWRVSQKLRERWPAQVEKELALAKARAQGTPGISRDVGNIVSQVMADPFAFLTEERTRLSAIDMTDGTASLLRDDEPLLEGIITLVETGDGWRFTFPVAFIQSSDFWPQTRYEWAVVASMMLGIENSLKDFERELDRGDFRDLRHASERVGRLIGESVVVQSVIYASMKRGAE